MSIVSCPCVCFCGSSIQTHRDECQAEELCAHHCFAVLTERQKQQREKRNRGGKMYRWPRSSGEPWMPTWHGMILLRFPPHPEPPNTEEPFIPAMNGQGFLARLM